MRVLIMLKNSQGGEFDRQTVFVGDEQPDTTHDILTALEAWALAPDIVITIMKVEE